MGLLQSLVVEAGNRIQSGARAVSRALTGLDLCARHVRTRARRSLSPAGGARALLCHPLAYKGGPGFCRGGLPGLDPPKKINSDCNGPPKKVHPFWPDFGLSSLWPSTRRSRHRGSIPRMGHVSPGSWLPIPTSVFVLDAPQFLVIAFESVVLLSKFGPQKNEMKAHPPPPFFYTPLLFLFVGDFGLLPSLNKKGSYGTTGHSSEGTTFRFFMLP